MMSAINIAAPSADAPPPRVTTLRALLPGADLSFDRLKAALVGGFEDGLGIACTPAEPDAAELALAQQIHDDEIGTEEFVGEINRPDADASVRHGADGPVSAWLRVEGARNDRVREVLFTGDFVMVPPRLVMDLESGLRGVTVDAVGDQIQAFFAQTPPQIATVPTDAFAKAIADAFAETDTGRAVGS